jgi:hypothetical protein
VLSHWKAFLCSRGFRLSLSLLWIVAASSGPWTPDALATGGHLHVSPGNLEFQSVAIGHYDVTSVDSGGAESPYFDDVSASLTTSLLLRLTQLRQRLVPRRSPPGSSKALRRFSSWAPSESGAASYCVYRSLRQNGPYLDYSPGLVEALKFATAPVFRARPISNTSQRWTLEATKVFS